MLATMSRNCDSDHRNVFVMFMRTTKYRQYAIKAVIKLDTGPASAVSAMPQRLFLKLAILTGTGRAQPKPNSSRHMKPIGSICAIGDSVTRPESRAVRSPSR